MNYLINPLSERMDNNAPHPPEVLLVAHLPCTLINDTEHRLTESQGWGGARQGKTHQSFQNHKESEERNSKNKRFFSFLAEIRREINKIMWCFSKGCLKFHLPLICHTEFQKIVMERQLD